MSKQIILASQSPQRKIIMDTLGLDYQIIPSDINEQSLKIADPYERVVELAIAKAQAVAKLHSKAIVIGADTYGLLSEEILEKPKTKLAAKQILKKLSGEWFSALTGVVIISKQNQTSELFETLIKFRKLSDKEIAHYVDNQPVTTWSAGFCPGYPEGAALVEKIDGNLNAFLYGLPIDFVANQLKAEGIK